MELIPVSHFDGYNRVQILTRAFDGFNCVQMLTPAVPNGHQDSWIDGKVLLFVFFIGSVLLLTLTFSLLESDTDVDDEHDHDD